MLIDNNILKSKNIFIYMNQKKFIVDSCDNFSTSLKIIIKNNDEYIKRTIRSQIEINILIYFCIIILIKYRNNKLLNCNIMFNFNNINQLRKKRYFFAYR